MHVIEPTQNECIKNLEYGIDTSNKLTLRWSWPEYNTGIVAAHCYDVAENPNEDINSLLSRNANKVVITRDEYNHRNGYSEQFTANNKVYRIYPVKIDKNIRSEGRDGIVIFNQTEGNLTERLYKKITLKYRIKYKNLGFGAAKKKVWFEFESQSEKRLKFIPEDALIYEKISSDNRIAASYPIDIQLLENGNYYILTENDSVIRLSLNERFKDTIFLKDM